MIRSDHALYRSDRQLVQQLLAAEQPSTTQITDAARLISRYQGTAHLDLVTDIGHAVKRWGFTLGELSEKAKSIWNAGWRPGGHSAPGDLVVGSGADSES